jgi:hypothetical protein
MRATHLLLVLGIAVAVAASTPEGALARGWQGVSPGASSESEVTARFGLPSTQGKLGGRTALVYKGDQAIAGTRQTQFFTREDGVIVEVVVFPASPLDRETVEGTYGRPTRKAFTDDFRTVWIFTPTGITVFFGRDGSVEAISFKAPAAGTRPAPAQASRPPASGQPETAPSKAEE